MTHGDLLRKAIKSSGHTRAQVAELLNMGESKLYSLMNQATINEDELKKIVNALKLPDTYFASDNSVVLSKVTEGEYRRMVELIETQKKLIEALEKKK